MIRIIVCLLLLILAFGDLGAQADNTLWATVRLRINPDDKSVIDLRPISRFHENYSDYRNTSIDYSYKRKVSSLVSVGILGRTWFLNDGSNRQFIWPSVHLHKKSGKSTLETRFMYHLALDIKEVPDADFFRTRPAINYPLSDKISSQIAFEAWWQFNDVDKFARTRYEFSLGYKISSHLSAGIMYRREEDTIRPDFDMIVTTVTYKI